MSKETEAAEKAEFIQSVKALLIPLSLFLSCVVMAAGTFLIYNGESIGWIFAAVSGTTVIAAFVALIRFQNKYRVKGIIRDNQPEDDAVIDFSPEQGQAPAPQALVQSQPSSVDVRTAVAVSARTPEPLALR